MRKIRSILFICLISGTSLFLPATAQVLSPVLPENPGESVSLFTDRSLYIVGEQLFFTAYYSPPPLPDQQPWSSVIYTELIRWNGAVIARTKVRLQDRIAKGTLQIPDGLESGNYYLRAYTRWMRNYSPYNYSYTTLRIINPATARTEQGPAAETDLISEGSSPRQLSGQELQLKGLEERYDKRAPVVLDVTIPDGLGPQAFTMSVTRKGLVDKDAVSFTFSSENDTLRRDSAVFFPEIRGLALSGRVVESETGAPREGDVVYLSSVNDPFYFSTQVSGADGGFIFTFPNMEGQYEFHVASESQADGLSELLIDNDFCNRPVQLPYIPFELKETEKEVVRQIALNAQLSNRFQADSVLTAPSSDTLYPFYGSASRTIIKDEFIELDDLQEFLYELVYEVSVRYQNDEPYMRISSQTSLISYPPLVLLDNIPVTDISAFLAMPSHQLDRVEVLNQGYVIGDLRYSGIISVFSRDNNRGGLKFFDNSRFFTYGLFEGGSSGFPSYTDQEAHSPVPDLRNTLYWEPRMRLSEKGDVQRSFYTGDAAGEYEVVIRGFDSEGQPVFFRSDPFFVQ